MRKMNIQKKFLKKLGKTELKSIKGKGWGDENKSEFKNCPPPFEPGGKKDDKESRM